jgi:hypothetical protein
MKISWDNIDKFKITDNSKFRYNKRYLVLREGTESCKICGDVYFTKQRLIDEGKGSFCGKTCSSIHKSQNINIKGKNNPCWRGGTVKRHLATFETYMPQLSPYGIKCRRSINDANVLEVKCHHSECSKWFRPSLNQTVRRIQTLKGNENYRGEQNLYCSDKCKKNCSSYGIKTEDLIKRDMIKAGLIVPNGIEVQSELSNMVLERDNWTCQKCGTRGDYLQCHHFEGIEINPIESADVDNCITLCKKCHKEVHKQDGCKYYDMRKCK